MEIMNKTLIITDTLSGYQLARELKLENSEIETFQSPYGLLDGVPVINVKHSAQEILERYNLVISIHCKQIFPSEIVNSIRCINVHPGFNPYNRGWFPHVFSIINGLKAGVTIHEMDDQIDHGKIIVQQDCPIFSWDTSDTVYRRLLKLEYDLLISYYPIIRDGKYIAFHPIAEGNINFKKDYESLKCFNLDEVSNFRDFVNRLRALTHSEYKNAYFINESGQKVFMKIIFEIENK
jgi:dTDP-4-amino-4,6-dideoxyglucose formyltransferase